jgi:hypothetical protein
MTELTDKQKNDADYDIAINYISRTGDAIRHPRKAPHYTKWAKRIYDWFAENDKLAITASDSDGPFVEPYKVLVAFYETGLIDDDVGSAMGRIMLDILTVFKNWGVQTQKSLVAELTSAMFAITIPDTMTSGLGVGWKDALDIMVAAGVEILVRKDFVEASTEGRLNDEPKDYRGWIEKRNPGCSDGDLWVRT